MDRLSRLRAFALGLLLFCASTVPDPAKAEEVKVFDADCLKDQMKICLSLLRYTKQSKPTDFLGQNFGRSRQYDDPNQISGNDYARCNALQPVTSAPQDVKDLWRRQYPLGCGRVEMQHARSVADCAEVGKTHEGCVRTVNILTAADVQIARESFTAQLDAWLSMLENAGAVHLSDHDSSAEPAPVLPSPGN